MKNVRLLLLVALAVLSGAGCASVYYGAMEKLGVHKRDIMTERVKKARDSQREAKQEFANALEQFKSVVSVKGGDLQAKYNKLSAALARSESSAQEVRDRIAAVESVSDALFKEWRAELKQYGNAALRRASEQQMQAARARYETLLAAMKKAESRIDPVLQPLRDQVLFLKHNLNAQAIGALTEEVTAVEARVDDLVRDMEASIREADAFIQSLSVQP
jgi:hypothetical protein